jgi:serine/threonine protein kinase
MSWGIWPAMGEPQRERALKDLQGILQQLRGIPAPATMTSIGAIDNGLAVDVRSRHAEFGGPFGTESEFNEWLVSLIHPESMQYRGPFYIDTIRNCLGKYNHQLRFTHGDLGPHNILVSEDGAVTAIIDWEFAGWYPEYWEFIKMIHFSRDPLFRSFIRGCWKDQAGNQVFYDEEFVIDQMLDSQVRHGEGVIKRPR